MKPKLLLFSDWFFPGFKAGGPIKSVTNLSIALQNDFEVFVFTSNTDLNEIKPYPNIQSNIWIKPIDGSNVNVYYCSKDKLNNATINTIIKEVNPTSIYFNHLWSFRFVLQPLFICWLFFRKIKIILCPRGALFESALHYLNTYPKKRIVISVIKMLGIHKKIHFHATTIQEKQTIEKYFGNVNISIANNLPDLQQPTLSIIEKKVGVLKLVFIARILEIKNLKFLLQNLFNINSEINVTIAGPIEDKNYWESCLETINTLPPNIKVNYIGEITPIQVMPLIQQHHLYCLPTQGENFGHSIFESFMIGRPVLISNKTPWLNLNTKKAGWDVNIIEQNSFETFIEEAANWQQNTFNAYCNGAWKVANDYIKNPTLVSTYFPIFKN
jgi:glycosyltransferase involved in cell wall biosynthesis